MRCNLAQKLISAHLDGELTDDQAQAVNVHLASCEACRAFAADLNRVAKGLDALAAPEPRWGFAERTLARLPDQQTQPTGWKGWLDWLRPAPVGVGLAAFSFGVLITVLVAGESYTNGATTETDIQGIAGDYFTALSELSVDEQLLALLPKTED
jgi:anti-sigma factor RsiW